MKPLVDWVCCSFRGVEKLGDFFSDFGLDFSLFVPSPGRNRYLYGYYWNHIAIWYNVHESGSYDVCLTLSGQGCRVYESLCGDDFDWILWFRSIWQGYKAGMFNFSRVDLALDVMDNSVPDMIQIIRAVELRKYVSRFRRVVTGHVNEEWVYFGSPTSDTRLRIYNKAMERHCPPGVKWVRFEFQYRDGSADRVINHMVHAGNLGQVFIDFLSESVRFVTKPVVLDNLRGHHQDRLPVSPWWRKFVSGAGRVTKLDHPGVEYNLDRAEKYISGQVAPTLAAYIQANGGDLEPLLKLIQRESHRMNQRQREMVENELSARQSDLRD